MDNSTPRGRVGGGGICGPVLDYCMWLLYVLSTKLDGTCHTDCSVCGSRFGVLSIWSVLPGISMRCKTNPTPPTHQVGHAKPRIPTTIITHSVAAPSAAHPYSRPYRPGSFRLPPSVPKPRLPPPSTCCCCTWPPHTNCGLRDTDSCHRLSLGHAQQQQVGGGGVALWF